MEFLDKVVAIVLPSSKKNADMEGIIIDIPEEERKMIEEIGNLALARIDYGTVNGLPPAPYKPLK